MDLKPYIAELINRRDLTFEQAQEAMDVIMAGAGTQAQIGSYLTALRMKRKCNGKMLMNRRQPKLLRHTCCIERVAAMRILCHTQKQARHCWTGGPPYGRHNIQVCHCCGDTDPRRHLGMNRRGAPRDARGGAALARGRSWLGQTRERPGRQH